MVRNILEPAIPYRSFPEFQLQDFSIAPNKIKMENSGSTIKVKFEYSDRWPNIRNGPFANEVFEFHSISFHLMQNKSVTYDEPYMNLTFGLELHMQFFNLKYGSYEKAGKQRNGLAILSQTYMVNKYLCNSLTFSRLQFFI